VRLLVLLLFSLPAQTPVPVWRLQPTGFTEHNLCLKPCVLKQQTVAGYHWEAT
jgi:hypothetical protein